MVDNLIDGIEEQLTRRRNFDSPPLHLWDPPLSGDIPIRIAADGTWTHENQAITRSSLVRLFASILRREDDGEYYLVTPVEKWRIQVELHPLIVTDIEFTQEAGRQVIYATLNTQKRVLINHEHGLFLDSTFDDIAAIRLSHGLTALFNRPAWYRLVNSAKQIDGVFSVESAGTVFKLE